MDRFQKFQICFASDQAKYSQKISFSTNPSKMSKSLQKPQKIQRNNKSYKTKESAIKFVNKQKTDRRNDRSAKNHNNEKIG